jgi:hypothetical protein
LALREERIIMVGNRAGLLTSWQYKREESGKKPRRKRERKREPISPIWPHLLIEQ